MPLQLILTEGILPKGQEKVAFSRLSEAMLRWHGRSMCRKTTASRSSPRTMPSAALQVRKRFSAWTTRPIRSSSRSPARTVEQKKALYSTIADRVSQDTGIRREDVIINLVETRRENWSFGNGVAPFAN